MTKSIVWYFVSETLEAITGFILVMLGLFWLELTQGYLQFFYCGGFSGILLKWLWVLFHGSAHGRLDYFARQLSGSSTTHCWSVHLTKSSSAVLRCVFEHRRLLWWKRMFWRILVRGFKHMRVNFWKICFCFYLSRGLLRTVSWCIDVLQA
jgi:hypothetical protein